VGRPTETQFQNRRAIQIENGSVRVTVTVEGGHIAEILDKATGVNPLWIPPWPSIEPTSYRFEQHPEFGHDAESRLLAGIMGHNLCLDIFGAPSDEEAAAGIVVHGEANLVAHDISSTSSGLTAKCKLPIAQLAFERRIRLVGRRVHVRETVTNLAPLDRPIAWTQHVTLGPPFLEKAGTHFRVPAGKSRAIGEETNFEWPWLPKPDGASEDLRVFTNAPSSGGYTAHLLNENGDAYFCAFSPASRVLFGYVWKRNDFPWLGIWEENHSRVQPPWNGQALTRGMEFGVSPFPESRRKMIDRGTLFGTPCYRWAPARGEVAVEYYAAITQASAIPESLAEFEALTA
jgi:hypothetical protein